MNHLAQGLIAVPALAGLLAFTLGRRNVVAFVITHLLTLVAFAASALLAFQFATTPQTQALTTISDLPLGPTLAAPMELRVTAVSALVSAVTLLVSWVVQLFSRWYLFSDPRYRSFTSTVALFTSAMLLVVNSNDILLTIVGWEVMGWCSFLLIGHESVQAAARRSAVKAFLVTRVADVPFIVGFVILAVGAKSTRISDILAVWGERGHATMLLVALLGIICGVFGKSAQLPFSDWLPDAMTGPTPASALIHAATMVAAGTMVMAQLNPLLANEPYARWVLVLGAGITSIWAACSAFLQPDMKRLLAWSTVSQVGLMLMGIGLLRPTEDPSGSILHLVGHAFFKSLLFLMIGWLSVIVGSTLGSRMSGAIRKLPLTFGPVAMGFFTMAGLPPTVAFVSKDLMLEAAARNEKSGATVGFVGLILIFVILVLTAAYSARAWFILQHRTTLERRGEQQIIADSHRVEDVSLVEMLRSSPEVDEFGDELEPVEEEEVEVFPRPGMLVRVGLWLLTLGALLGGMLAFTPLINAPTEHINWPMMAATLLLVLASGMAVRVMSLRQLYGDAARRLPRRWGVWAERGFGLERAYRVLVGAPVMAASRLVRRVDAGLDTAVSATPKLFSGLGSGLNRVHTQSASTGLPWVAVGIVLASVLGVVLW